jgi:tetratricopeptide (TPR) repeat protein
MSLPRPLRPALLSSLLSLLSLTSFAQDKPTAPAPPPQVAEATQKLEAGDLKGAIALLEPLRKPGAHPSGMALLGALYLETDRPREALELLGPLADSGAAEPQILYNAGRAALALGDKARAGNYLEGAVARAPVSPASRVLGILRGSEGRIDDSYRLLRPWVTAHPEDQEARLSAAFCALELDRPPEAEELLAGVPPDDPRGRLLRGRLQLVQQDPRAAIATLEPLLANGPPSLQSDARRFLAEAHRIVGESAAAIALLQGHVGNDPTLALVLARAQYRAGEVAAAAATLEPFARALLAKEPVTPRERSFTADLARDYGQALVGTSQWTAAIAALEVATRLNPQSLPAWQLLGRAQLAAGRREDAMRSMQQFQTLQRAGKSNTERVNELKREAADPTARNLQRAATLASAGKTDEALALIREEIDLVPADPRPRTAEVSTLLAARRSAEALKAAEAALRAGQGAAMNDLAAKLIADGSGDDARMLLRKILEVQPGDAAAAAALKRLEKPK